MSLFGVMILTRIFKDSWWTNMPEFVVTQTSAEYAAYTKKKQKEAVRAGILSLFLSAIACGIIYWMLWEMVNIG